MTTYMWLGKCTQMVKPGQSCLHEHVPTMHLPNNNIVQSIILKMNSPACTSCSPYLCFPIKYGRHD